MRSHFAQVAAADSARGDDHVLAGGAKGAPFGHAAAEQRGRLAVGDLDIGDLVLEHDLEVLAPRVRLQRIHSSIDDFKTGAPGNVPARDAVAWTEDSAL